MLEPNAEVARESTAMRRITGLVLILLAAVSVVGTAPAGADTVTSPDAVAYQGDVAHDGHVIDPAIRLPLTELWSVPIVKPSYPIIADGLVIVTSLDPSSGYGTRLSAFDAADGEQVWERDLDEHSSWSNAAYDNGMVFDINADGLLRAFDAATGSDLWSVDLPFQSWFSSSPTAVAGVVYVEGAGFGGTVYAVDEADGTVLWFRGTYV